jgi:hypothetical protein
MKRYATLAAAVGLLSAVALPVLAQEGGSEQPPIVKKKDANGAEQGEKTDRVTNQSAQNQKKKQQLGATEEPSGGASKDSSGKAAQTKPSGEDTSKSAAGTEEKPKAGTSAGTAAETKPPREDTSKSAAGTEEKQKAGTSAGETTTTTQESTPQAGASGETTANVNVSTDQQKQIRDVIIEERAKPVDVGTRDVSVGFEVPRTVRLRPLPSRVVEIVPQYRDYEYFVLDDGRINIVDPGTHKVVDIVTTEGVSQQARTGVSRETTASIDISSERQAEIRDIIVATNVQPVDIDTDIAVGVEIPRTVTLQPLPAEVIKIVPAYEDYMFFVLADGRIIIVDPDTYQIVYILTV